MAVLQPHEVRDVTLIAITAVASDDLLSQRLVLKGGNALQLVYEIGYRASVDLDFSVAGDIDGAELRTRLHRSLTSRFDRAGYVVFDFRCEPRPHDSASKTWGGYTAEFKLIRQSDIAALEAAESERLGRKAALAAKRALPPTASRTERRSLETTKAARAAAPSSLSEEERLQAWRRNNPQTHSIDVSRYEYVEGHDRTLIRNFDVAVYTPAMIAAEKLRAICQQMPEYPQRKNPAPRARDFYDLHALATSSLKVDIAEHPDLVRAMFAAKEVPVSLLPRIPTTREFHRTNWETVLQAIAGERPHPFDFYFDFVIDQLPRLQPLWEP